MSLKESTARRSNYLLSVEEPVLPEFITRENPDDPYWIIEKLPDDLPIISGYYMIQLASRSGAPFNTKLIRRANPAIKFQRVAGNRGKLPQSLFDLLPSTGFASKPYTSKKNDPEYLSMRKVVRAFARDGKYHDLFVRYELDGQSEVHRLQILFAAGKYYGWYVDRRYVKSTDPDHKKNKIRPLSETDIYLYNRARSIFPHLCPL